MAGAIAGALSGAKAVPAGVGSSAVAEASRIDLVLPACPIARWPGRSTRRDLAPAPRARGAFAALTRKAATVTVAAG